MVELADIQTAYYMVAATGVLVAAIYYVYNLRASIQTRQAQLFMQLFDRWSSSELAMKYGRACYEIYPKCNNDPEEFNKFFYHNVSEQFNSEIFVTFHQLTLFFEGVAILVRKGLVDIDLVERLFYDRVIWFWGMMKPRVISVRESFGPNHLEDLEWLYNELTQRRGKRTN